MRYEDYTEAVRLAPLDNNASWRYGQTLYNVLHRMRPDIATEVQGTNIDPYYSDHLETEERNLVQCRFLTYVKFRLDREWIDLND